MAEAICQICNENAGKYACPRCNILYCSIPCYKSEQHVTCSEQFYENCVKEEWGLQQNDPESIKKMLEILKRQNDEHEDCSDESDSLDSDDEEPETDLANRLNDVNLDDADAVWTKLTAEEKKEFKELIKSGGITKIIPEWEPWWMFSEKKTLVKDLNSKDEIDWKSKCPSVPPDIPSLSQLTKVQPSSSIPFMLYNVLLSYTFTARWFKGEHEDMPVESASTVVALSGCLRTNQVFENILVAHSAFDTDLHNCKWIQAAEEDKTTAYEDVMRITNGPNETDMYFYVQAALSDLNSLFLTAADIIKSNKGVTESFINSTPKPSDLKAAAKKVMYYMSWVVDYGHLLKSALSDFQSCR